MMFATVAAMRLIEDLEYTRNGTSHHQMMVDAGNSAAEILCKRYEFKDKKVTVLCGRGNNGGDGYVVASRLYEKGAQVTVVLVKGAPSVEPASLTLKEMPRGIQFVTLPCKSFSGLFSVDFIIDALYGIGFSGEPADDDDPIFCMCRQSTATKIALDLPSGSEGDSGRYIDCIKADVTIAMVVFKPAHLVSWSRDFCGEILLAETPLTATAMASGFMLHSLTAQLCAPPERCPWSHKGDNGRLAVVCGSRELSGAAVLACAGALRCGVGYVNLISTQYVCEVVAAHCPEVVFTNVPENNMGGIDSSAAGYIAEIINKSSAALVGCGMGNNEHTAEIVKVLIDKCVKPLLLDADGVNGLQGNIELLENAHCPIALTPHPGEFSHLAESHIIDSDGDMTLAAARVSSETGATLLLKGAITGIFRGMRQPVFSFMGNDGLARGGSGDLLSGIIASLMAQRLDVDDAVLSGAWLHGRIAELAALELNRRWMLPSDLPDYLSFALDELDSITRA